MLIFWICLDHMMYIARDSLPPSKQRQQQQQQNEQWIICEHTIRSLIYRVQKHFHPKTPH